MEAKQDSVNAEKEFYPEIAEHALYANFSITLRSRDGTIFHFDGWENFPYARDEDLLQLTAEHFDQMLIIQAEGYGAAERKAVDQCKADHEQSHRSDQAAGFKAVATYSKREIEDFLDEMESPNPHV